MKATSPKHERACVMLRLMSCNHPLAALKPESAEIAENGTLSVSFTCSLCLVHATKEFLGDSPEPDSIIARPSRSQMPV